MSRRTLCVLLLIFAVAVSAAYWVEVVGNTLDQADRGARRIEPEFYAYTDGGYNYDFFQYYASGYNWRIGLDPYKNHPMTNAGIPNPRHQDKAVSGFIYPPTALPLYAALSDLTYEDARHAWAAITFGFLALSVAVAAWSYRGRRLEVVTAAVLLLICSYPFLYHMHQGQIDLIVGALSVSAFVLYGRWKDWPSACLLAAAILVKVTPVLLLGVMVLYFRDVRLLVKTAVLLVAGVLVSFAAVSPHLYAEFFTTVLPRASVSDPDRYNQTLVRFWASIPFMVRVMSGFGYLALLFFAFLSGRNRDMRGGEIPVERDTEARAILLLTVVMTLLFSPLAWQMAYVMTIVPLALLLVSPSVGTGNWALICLAFGAVLMSSQIYNVQVLNMLNVLGAGLVTLTLIKFYLPLQSLNPAPVADLTTVD